MELLKTRCVKIRKIRISCCVCSNSGRKYLWNESENVQLILRRCTKLAIIMLQKQIMLQLGRFTVRPRRNETTRLTSTSFYHGTQRGQFARKILKVLNIISNKTIRKWTNLRSTLCFEQNEVPLVKCPRVRWSHFVMFSRPARADFA